MNVLIRTDASVMIGSGHVMRCLTIASELHKRGHKIVFAMRDLPGHLTELVNCAGFETYLLKGRENGEHLLQSGSYDLCIIDHYDIDYQWEREIRSFVKKMIVIDDLANRIHDCDILLDQNVVPNFEERYDLLVPDHCEKLLGPNFLMMRNEFIEERKQIRNRIGEVHRLLVFMGGTDPTGETLKVLSALSRYKSHFKQIDIVVGQGNPEREKIRLICRKEEFSYYCQINYLASLMGKADFSIGAGGSTTWERCYIGLPSSSTIVAENQIEATEMTASLDVVWNLGWHEQVTDKTYEQLILSLHGRKEELKRMSVKGLKLTENPDGPNPWVDRFLDMR